MVEQGPEGQKGGTVDPGGIPQFNRKEGTNGGHVGW